MAAWLQPRQFGDRIMSCKVVPGLVNVYILLWKDPPFLMGKSTIYYFDWAIFNCYVSSPEGKPNRKSSPKSPEMGGKKKPSGCPTLNILSLMGVRKGIQNVTSSCVITYIKYMIVIIMYLYPYYRM